MKPYIDVAPILAATLRRVAASFDNPTAYRHLFDAGICSAVFKLWPHEHMASTDDIYGYVDKLLALVQHGWFEGYGDYLTCTSSVGNGQWADRANMCLFMAEWIESELL